MPARVKYTRATRIPRCPLCGQTAEVTHRGNVSETWSELFGHRAADGEPCRGPKAVKRAVHA